jgi:DNA (cytosine-5)-methyltransferase 1
MRDGLIPRGDVDERDIEDVEKADLEGYDQAHFFAGIGGWPLALALAGVPDDFPLWTGSCPCQDFSVAGNQTGFEGERDLWPEFHRLIAARRPALVFGEQVEAAVRVGDERQSWLDRLASDLRETGYEVGSAVLSALLVGANHRRERIYFVADSDGESRTPVLKPLGRGERGEDFWHGFWSDREWYRSKADGKKHGREPNSRLVDDGLPATLALLRGAGNAIVPQLAAEFVSAFFEAKGQMRKPKAMAAKAGR